MNRFATYCVLTAAFGLSAGFGWSITDTPTAKRLDSIEQRLDSIEQRLALNEVSVRTLIPEKVTGEVPGQTPLEGESVSTKIMDPERRAVIGLALSRVETKLHVKIPDDLRDQILEGVCRAETEHGLDALMLISIMGHESRFNPEAVGPCGEIGLMQIHLPSWRRHYGFKSNAAFREYLQSIDNQIDVGVDVFALCKFTKHGTRSDYSALRCYNGSDRYPRRVLVIYRVAIEGVF